MLSFSYDISGLSLGGAAWHREIVGNGEGQSLIIGIKVYTLKMIPEIRAILTFLVVKRAS
jgi:hypothetical protein